MLEALGRGTSRSPKTPPWLGAGQTNLGRTLQQLLDAPLLKREITFGEILRTSKKTHHLIGDPPLSFWFWVYFPQRSLWHRLTIGEKTSCCMTMQQLVFEDYCRFLHPDAARCGRRKRSLIFIQQA